MSGAKSIDLRQELVERGFSMNQRYLFPRWTNKFLALCGALLVGGGVLYAGPMFLAATSPETLNTGYQPTQPVPFSHALHAGQLKMDCRYCHTSVDKSAHSSIPATQTCINCHSPATPNGPPTYSAVHSNSPKLQPVRDSWRTGESIDWVRIHRLPDYVYFNHSAHVNRGVSCVTCHGRVDKMESRLSSKRSIDGLVYRLSSQSRTSSSTCRVSHETGLESRRYRPNPSRTG